MVSVMESEALQTWKVVKSQLCYNEAIIKRIAGKLRIRTPGSIMIIGRGSSDHAGVFAKYLFEIELNIPTFASAPSVSSVYNKKLSLENTLAIVISQSGRSPDIIAQATMAKESGAYCIGIINEPNTPLANVVDDAIPMRAGQEKAVAATKSYIATLCCLLQLVAEWKIDKDLHVELQKLPFALREVSEQREQLKLSDLLHTTNMIVLGRGFGFAIAKEIALKLKEVCCIHAEAFSSAEFLHGPVTLVESGLKVLSCNVYDESIESHNEQLIELTRRTARVIPLSTDLEIHPRIEPLLLLLRFYIDVARVSIDMGLDPDSPKGLKKVTRTL